MEKLRELISQIKSSRIPVSFDGKYFERAGNTTREMKLERLRRFFSIGGNLFRQVIDGEEALKGD